MDPPHQVIYDNPGSLIVINSSGKMKQLYVPIRVVNILPLEHIPLYTRMYIEEIRIHPQHLLVYRILNVWYPYWCFRL